LEKYFPPPGVEALEAALRIGHRKAQECPRQPPQKLADAHPEGWQLLVIAFVFDADGHSCPCFEGGHDRQQALKGIGKVDISKERVLSLGLGHALAQSRPFTLIGRERQIGKVGNVGFQGVDIARRYAPGGAIVDQDEAYLPVGQSCRYFTITSQYPLLPAGKGVVAGQYEVENGCSSQRVRLGEEGYFFRCQIYLAWGRMPK